WTPGAGVATPAQVQAYLKDSSVHAGGDLTQTAIAAEIINSLVLSGSVAIGAGGEGTISLAGSASGGFCENKVGVDAKAYIDGDRSSGTTGISADSIKLDARDNSSIHAVAAAVSLSLAIGAVGGGALSVGVSLARNTITSDVAAYIRAADG